MISKLSIVQYRKLKSLDLDFCPGVNIISGTNGTCKSSVLHMISNAYKRAKQSANPRMLDGACVSTIARINAGMNCKIESLVRGDKNIVIQRVVLWARCLQSTTRMGWL